MLRRFRCGGQRAGGFVVAVAVGADHSDHADERGLREDDDGSHGCTSFSALFAKMGGAAEKVRGKPRAIASSSGDRRKSVQMRRGPAKTCACHEKGRPRERPPLWLR